MSEVEHRSEDPRNVDFQALRTDACENGPLPGGVDPSWCFSRNELPPPRVRFTTPVELWLDSDAGSSTASVLNLSEGGMAFATDTSLRLGERFWARFRLDLVSAANDYLCAVTWQQTSVDGGSIYGCRFCGLEPDERRALGQVVEPRTQGDAEAWSVDFSALEPSVPAPFEPSPPVATPLDVSDPKRASERGEVSPPRHPALKRIGLWRRDCVAWWGEKLVGWASTTGGMVVGLLCAAAFGVLWSLGDTGEGDDHQAVSEVALDDSPPIRLGERTASSDGALAMGSAEVEATVESPTQDEALFQGALSTGVETSNLPRIERREVSSTAIPRTTELDARSVAPPRVSEFGDRVELRLEVDGRPDDYRGFWLDSPRRYVVDVLDRLSAFDQMSYPLRHGSLYELRIGRHPDKVRFVVEADASVAWEVEHRVDGRALVVSFSKS